MTTTYSRRSGKSLRKALAEGRTIALNTTRPDGESHVCKIYPLRRPDGQR